MFLKKILITLGVLTILCGALSDLYHFYQLFKNDPNEVTFIAPGTTEFEVTKTGKYTLWHNYKTLYQGEFFNNQQDIPGGTVIQIINDSGASVPLGLSMGSHTTSGNHAKVSIGEVVIMKPTKLTIQVDSTLPRTVFSFSESRFLKNFFAIFISTFFIFAGAGLLFWGCVITPKKHSTPPPLPNTKS
jgi:hypothetical protein